MENETSKWEKVGLVVTFTVGLLLMGAWAYLRLQPQPARRVAGFIVAKEWTKRHMSNKIPPRVQEASLLAIVPVPHVYVPPPAPPHLVRSVFRVWVANREAVRTVEVDSAHWFTLHCGQRCTYFYAD